MIIICGWCRKDMGVKEPRDNREETTGICPSCMDRIEIEHREYLQIKESPNCGVRSPIGPNDLAPAIHGV
jgi:uncharacterized CHY-type Zn-finger protein